MLASRTGGGVKASPWPVLSPVDFPEGKRLTDKPSPPCKVPAVHSSKFTLYQLQMPVYLWS